MTRVGKTVRTIALVTALAHGASGCAILEFGCRALNGKAGIPVLGDDLSAEDINRCVVVFGISVIVAAALLAELKNKNGGNGSVSSPPGGGSGPI